MRHDGALSVRTCSTCGKTSVMRAPIPGTVIRARRVVARGPRRKTIQAAARYPHGERRARVVKPMDVAVLTQLHAGSRTTVA